MSVLHNKNLFVNIVLGLMILSVLLDVIYPGARCSRELETQNRLVCHAVRAAILMSMCVFVLFNYSVPKLRTVWAWEMLLFSFGIFLLFYALFYENKFQILTFIKIIYWVVGYVFFRLLGVMIPNYKKKMLFLVFSIFAFGLWYYVDGTEFRQHVAGKYDIAGSNSGWMLLYTFLLALPCSKIRTGKVICVLSLIMIPLTLKRGAILAECAVLFSLLISCRRLSPPRVFNAKIFKIVVPSVTLGLIACLSFLDIIIKRFANILDDGGSGRAVFFNLIYQRWSEANLWNWLFGFGLWTVPDYLGAVWINNVFAHSDWFEMLHDHGLIGLALYLCLIFALFSLYVQAWKLRSESLYIIGAVFSVFFVKGLISGNVMFRETIYMMIPLSYAVNNLENTKQMYLCEVERELL